MEALSRLPAADAPKGMTVPSELEDYFMNRLTEMLAAHGKHPGVWNGSSCFGRIHPRLPRLRLAARQSQPRCYRKGYRTVVMPGEYFYFDMRQTPKGRP